MTTPTARSMTTRWRRALVSWSTMVVLLRGEHRRPEELLEDATVGLDGADVVVLPLARLEVVHVQRADRRQPEVQRYAEDGPDAERADLLGEQGQRGSEDRSAVHTFMSCTRESTHGPSPVSSWAGLEGGRAAVGRFTKWEGLLLVDEHDARPVGGEHDTSGLDDRSERAEQLAGQEISCGAVRRSDERRRDRPLLVTWLPLDDDPGALANLRALQGVTARAGRRGSGQTMSPGDDGRDPNGSERFR